MGTPKSAESNQQKRGIFLKSFKERKPPVLGIPPNLIVRNSTLISAPKPPPPGEIFWVDPKSRTRRKISPPEEQPPKLIWGSLRFLVWKPPNPPPSPSYTHYQYSGGWGFLHSNNREKKNLKLSKKGLWQRLCRKKHISSRAWSLRQERKKERKKEVTLVLVFEIPSRYVSVINCAPLITVSGLLSPSGLKSGGSFMSRKQKKSSQDPPPKKETSNNWVKIHPQRKKQPTTDQMDKSDPREKYLCEPVRKPREIETCDKSEFYRDM